MAEEKNSGMVLVGCKLPHGLNLDLYDAGNNLKHRQKLRGIMGFHIPNPDRKFVNPETSFGHTITPVPRAHWDAWLEKNKNHPAIVNGFIYVAKSQSDAVAIAKEHENELTGAEQLDPKKQGDVVKLDEDPRPLEAR
jgi:hypothetical protein